MVAQLLQEFVDPTCARKVVLLDQSTQALPPLMVALEAAPPPLVNHFEDRVLEALDGDHGIERELASSAPLGWWWVQVVVGRQFSVAGEAGSVPAGQERL